MSNKILESNNYKMFELLSFNRDVKKLKSVEVGGYVERSGTCSGKNTN